MPGEIGIDVGYASAYILTFTSLCSCVAGACTMYTFWRDYLMRGTFFAKLIACLIWNDFMFALQFVILSPIRIVDSSLVHATDWLCKLSSWFGIFGMSSICWNIALVFNSLIMVTRPIDYIWLSRGKILLVGYTVFSWGLPLLVLALSSVLGWLGPISTGVCFLVGPAQSVLTSLVFLFLLLSMLAVGISWRKLGIRLTSVNGLVQTNVIRELWIFVLAFVFSFSLCAFDNVDLNSPIRTYGALTSNGSIGFLGFVSSMVWFAFLSRTKRASQKREDLEKTAESTLARLPTSINDSTMAFDTVTTSAYSENSEIE
jgi:hypothetical protein